MRLQAEKPFPMETSDPVRESMILTPALQSLVMTLGQALVSSNYSKVEDHAEKSPEYATLGPQQKRMVMIEASTTALQLHNQRGGASSS